MSDSDRSVRATDDRGTGDRGTRAHRTSDVVAQGRPKPPHPVPSPSALTPANSTNTKHPSEPRRENAPQLRPIGTYGFPGPPDYEALDLVDPEGRRRRRDMGETLAQRLERLAGHRLDFNRPASDVVLELPPRYWIGAQQAWPQTHIKSTTSISADTRSFEEIDRARERQRNIERAPDQLRTIEGAGFFGVIAMLGSAAGNVWRGEPISAEEAAAAAKKAAFLDEITGAVVMHADPQAGLLGAVEQGAKGPAAGAPKGAGQKNRTNKTAPEALLKERGLAQGAASASKPQVPTPQDQANAPPPTGAMELKFRQARSAYDLLPPNLKVHSEPPQTVPKNQRAAFKTAQQNQMEMADAVLGKTKSAAFSEGVGVQIYSGPGRTGTPADFPQHAAPGVSTGQGRTNLAESDAWIKKYVEVSGMQPRPTGRDYARAGDNVATHAEVKDRILQLEKGVNTPTGVSQDMCPACRRWFQATAQHRNVDLIVNDGSFTRVFRTDGSVEIRRPSGKLRRIVKPGVAPSAQENNYFGVDW